MSLKNCCTPKNPESNVNVNVNVDVPKIVKYACITGVLIVGIIFGTKSFHKMLEHGFFDPINQ
jgi:hypothetical protein